MIDHARKKTTMTNDKQEKAPMQKQTSKYSVFTTVSENQDAESHNCNSLSEARNAAIDIIRNYCGMSGYTYQRWESLHSLRTAMLMARVPVTIGILSHWYAEIDAPITISIVKNR
jgi:hypothetical protein